MSEGPPGRWFKFYAQKYLIGSSIRAETEPDERSVWVDLLCTGADGAGRFSVSNRDVFAAQLCITRELLDRAIKKFIDTNRLTVHYDKREKKEIFFLPKWAYHQAPKESHKKTENPEGVATPPLQTSPPKKDEIDKIDRERERTAAHFCEKDKKDAAESPPLPDIPESFSLKVKDELREMKDKIRELERLSMNEHGRQMAGFSPEELQTKIERARKAYVQAIEDRR